MSRTNDTLRAVLIAPEWIALLGAVLLREIRPEVVLLLGDNFEHLEEARGAWMLGIPTALLASSVLVSRKILFPQPADKRLTKSPFFQPLKSRVYVGIGWCLAAVLITAALALYPPLAPITWRGTLWIGLTLSSLVATATMYMASNRVNEILDVTS